MKKISKSTRSRMMAGVRTHDTAPEITVRSHLHRMGFRFRLQQKIGKARPDIILKRWNTCIFVHGCYWHRHKSCKHASIPKSNREFWKKKLASNVKRDKKNIKELEAAGWSVGVIWECQVKNGSFADGRLKKYIRAKKSWTIG